MVKKQKSNSVAGIFKELRQAISASVISMVKTWQKILEENSLNPKSTYQKPLHHQPNPERGILYELPKNEPAAFLNKKKREEIYNFSKTAPKSAFANLQPPSNTLYRVFSNSSPSSSIYEKQSTQNGHLKYPNSLSYGYQRNQRNSEVSIRPKYRRQYSPSQLNQ